MTRPVNTRSQIYIKTCLQALGIVAAAVILGLLVNAVRPQGLALIRPPQTTVPADSGSNHAGAQPITPAAGLELLRDGQAIFIDARSEDDYRAGHIKTARNLPEKIMDIWMPDFFDTTPPETVLIIYCGGPRCHLAERLAAQLYEFGYTKTFHMTAGWDGWLAAGYPAE